jgi:hypothetical protein
MNMQVADLTMINGTVVAKAPAPSPKSPGKIKLADGTILSAFEEKLALVREGATYAFGIVLNQGNNGKSYRNIKTIKPLGQIADNPQFVGTDEVVAQRRAMPAQAQRPPAQRSEPIDPPHQPAQRGAAFPVEWNRPTHPRDSRRMFICAQLAQDIAAGRVGHDEDSYVERVLMWSRVYDRSIGLDDPN